MIKTQPISVDGVARLEECERVIGRGLTVFFEVGQALAEIRNAKLYLATHETFEAYCKERWDLGRSRAYELIDQAKVGSAIADAGVDLSAMADMTKREVKALKENLPSAAKDIGKQVSKGEKPRDALKKVVQAKLAAKEKAKAEQAAQQAENDRLREQHAAALPQAVKDHEAAKAEAIAARKAKPIDVEALTAELEELREANTALEAELTKVKAENAKWEAMRVQFEQGGFEKVIAGKDEEIRVLKTRVSSESQEKVRNLNSFNWAMKKLSELGFSRNAEIDIETGEVLNG